MFGPRMLNGRAMCLAFAATLALLAPCVASAESRPTIVELYTSEGCSSCPPAEELLTDFVGRSDVLPLAFHVDYWDGLGWRDRFSMKEATQRQNDHARTLKLTTVGTPQFIVDGRTSIWGAERKELEHALKPSGRDVPFQLIQNGRDLVIRLPDRELPEAYGVYVVGYRPSAVTPVGRGENAGRTLTEVNVVRYIRKLGVSGAAAREWTFHLDSLPADAARVVVFLQSQTSGAIAGAQVIDRSATAPHPPSP